MAAIEEKRQEVLALKPKLDEAESELADKKSQLDSGWATYYAGEDTYASEVAKAEGQLAEGRKELDDARTKLEDACKELEQKSQELADAKAELADKEAEFVDAQNDMKTLRDTSSSWSVLTRAKNGGVVSLESFIDIASRLRTSMASLFVVVGLFVCYSAISRLVREQARQIGVKKALGMRASEVTASYLLYAGATVVVGAILGVLGAVIVVERIIVPVLTSSFIMKPSVWWSLPYALGFFAMELVLILAATWLACRSVLSHNAVDLLAGSEIPQTKERFFERWKIWQNLPLYTQTTINNLLNDRRRVIGTLVGVAGCTALLVCAVTLNDDVVAGVERQYASVYHYDTVARLNTDEGAAATHAETALTDFWCTDTTAVATRTVQLDLPDASTTAATITIPLDNEDFSQLVTLTSVSGDTAGTQITPGESGVWVSNAYADHYDVKPGDVMKVRVGDGTAYELPIAGFYRNYLVGHQIVMDAKLYRQIFGVDATASKLLVNRGSTDFDELKDAMDGESSISAVINDRSDQETLFNSFRKVSRVVVLVYLALSVVMAVVVLLNLNVMFVEEKRRDLITLMVCGYSVADAKGYIWRDNVVLTVLGVLLGMVVGMIAGWVAVLSMEISTMSLVKTPVLRACIIGVVVSAFLSTVMTLISLRRVARLKLSDINRT